METISGEVVVDWCNFTEKEVVVGDPARNGGLYFLYVFT